MNTGLFQWPDIQTMPMTTRTSVLFLSSYAAVLPLSATVVFSNDFEDGNLDPEVGSWTFSSTPTVTGVVPTAVANDPTLGNNVGLIDQGQILALELGLTGAVPITPGYTAEISFDWAARRTSGNSKTIFIDALDSNGDIVVRLVMGDSGAFGNGGSDRQRPGHDPTSAGAVNTANTIFGSPPGSFWWGSDGSTATFDVIRDAHVSLSISATSFDFSTTNAGGTSFSTSGVGNRDAGTYDDIASIELSSAGTNYGFYLDNFVVEGIPEPSSALLLGFAGLGFLGRRNR